jgi:hypothetical protein
MRTTTDHTASNGGDPAEEALMEELSRYLSAVSKSATEPTIAAMHQQERQLAALSKSAIESLIAATRQQERQLAELSKSTTESVIAGMHQQERQLSECIRKLGSQSAAQSTLISRWMTIVFLVVLAEVGLIITLLMR